MANSIIANNENIIDIDYEEINPNDGSILQKHERMQELLRMNGYLVNAVQYLQGKRGNKSKILFKDWINAPIELDYLMYRIGKQGSFRVYIKPVGAAGGMQNMEQFDLDISPQEYTDCYTKYKYLDDLNNMFPNSQASNPFGLNFGNPYMQQSPSMGAPNPFYPPSGAPYYPTSQPPQNEQWKMMEMMRDMFEKMMERMERKKTDDKVFDSDTMKLILTGAMFQQNNEVSKTMMAALMKGKQDDGGNDDKLFSLLTALVTKQQPESSSIKDLGALVDLTLKTKELIPEGGQEKSMLETLISSPAIVPVMQGLAQKFLGGDQQRPAPVMQQPAQPQPAQPDPQMAMFMNKMVDNMGLISNSMNSMSSTINSLSKRLEALETEVEMDEVIDEADEEIDDIENDIDDDIKDFEISENDVDTINKVNTEVVTQMNAGGYKEVEDMNILSLITQLGGSNFSKFGNLIDVLTKYIQGKISKDAAITLLEDYAYEYNDDGEVEKVKDELIASLLKSMDAGEKGKIMDELRKMGLLDETSLKKIEELIDYYASAPAGK